MKTAARLAIACFACAAGWAGAVEAPSWPPPPNVEARMRELQLVIIDRDSTLAQREAAREELASLLKAPRARRAGARPTSGRRVPRAPRSSRFRA